MKKMKKRSTIRVLIMSALAGLVVFSTTMVLSAHAAGSGETALNSGTQSDQISNADPDEVYFIYGGTTEGKTSHFRANAVYNGSYRSELTEHEALIYDAMYTQYVSRQSNDEVSINLSGLGYTLNDFETKIADMVDSARFAFVYDHPEAFWISGFEYSCSINENDYIVSLYLDTIEYYPNAFSELNIVNSGITSAVNYITSSRQSTSRYHTLKAIHDYICNNVSYDYDVLENGAYAGQHAEDQTVAPLFGGGRRGRKYVCAGYAASLKLLCEKFGIPCVRIYGSAGGARAWKLVQMESGKWYAVDVTWDDGDTIDYTYFLVGSDIFNSQHSPITDLGTYNSLAYPTLSGTRYVYGGSFKEIVDLGDDFYRVILMTDPWKPITNSNGNVVLSKEVGNATQVWKFKRTSEGAYYIISAKDGKYLSVPGFNGKNGANVCMEEPNGSVYQKWFIHKEAGTSYSISSACNETSNNQMLSVANSSSNDGTNVYTYAWVGATGQMFSFYGGEECVPLKASTLSVSPGTSADDTVFSWTWVYGYDHFNLRLWNGTYWKGDSFYSSWNNTGLNHKAKLQAGYYEGYVDTVHALDIKMSNVICFTVKPDLKIVRQSHGNYSISWDPVLSASSYRLEIINTQTNQTVFSKTVSKDTRSLNISVGTGEYKARVVTTYSQTYQPSNGSQAISSFSSDNYLFTVPAPNPATAITLYPTSRNLINGSSSTLTATVTPSRSTDDVVWSSSDTSVATVSNGTVKAVGIGKATITAKAGNYSATCAVTVIPKWPYNVKATAQSYTTIKLQWTADPSVDFVEVWRTHKANATQSEYVQLGIYYANAGTSMSRSLTPGKTYYYKFRGYSYDSRKEHKYYSAYSPVVSATAKSLPAPYNVKATRASSTSVKLQWTASSDAQFVEVWRTHKANAVQSEYVQLGIYNAKDGTSMSKNLTPGKTYYYKLRAYSYDSNKKKVYSGYSAIVRATP